MGQGTENKEFSKSDVCDAKKPITFPAAYKNSFNCSSFATTLTGLSICNADPCSSYFDNCVWQLLRGREHNVVFPEGGSSKYYLYPCHRCNWENCGGRYYKDYEICKGGKMVTSDNGDTWKCQDDTCQGNMIKQADGSWMCVDKACSGSMEYSYSKQKWQCYENTCKSPASLTYEGSEWKCEDNRCPGYMRREANGWTCTDNDCEGIMKFQYGSWKCQNISSGFSLYFHGASYFY